MPTRKKLGWGGRMAGVNQGCRTQEWGGAICSEIVYMRAEISRESKCTNGSQV